MQLLNKEYEILSKDFELSWATLRLDKRLSELAVLESETEQADFWQDAQHAQTVTKKKAAVSVAVQPWLGIKQQLHELGELLELGDESMEEELKQQMGAIQHDYNELKGQLKFTGRYDDHAALVTLMAGAGGTDAQDWTQILLRMYVRWAEQHSLKIAVLEEVTGDEAGLKRATFEVEGDYAFGRLQGEHGVHRLVRLSPFNADSLRQTSFAKVEVLPKIDTPDELQIDDKDLKIDVFRAGGHGGQSVNTTDSAVRVTHVPTGVTVSIQNERSQLQNKETALTILRSKLAQLQIEQHQEKIDALKGPNQAAEWGSQIRNYVLHPYKQVKDLRTKYETSNAEAVLDGDIDQFIDAYLEHNLGHE